MEVGVHGLPDHGWLIEIAGYDVSANVVFIGGADFDPPPPLPRNHGPDAYVKVTNLEAAQRQDLKQWIEQAARIPGWK